MISILCDHINTKPKLVAIAKKWQGGKRQVFVNRLCCVECGELIKPRGFYEESGEILESAWDSLKTGDIVTLAGKNGGDFLVVDDKTPENQGEIQRIDK